MAEFNKKKTYKKYIYSPVTFILLVIVALVLLKALWGVYQKERISAQYLEREKVELEKITERQRNLAQSVEYIKTDKGIEEEIRTKFHMVKEGESVAVIIDDEQEPLATTTSTGRISGFWNWFSSFFIP